MNSRLERIKVDGIAAAVSSQWVPLQSVSDESEEFIERFTRKTGVEGRYEAFPKQTTSDFCCAAVKRLLEEKKVDRRLIGVLVFVTQTSDYELPATACLLQDRLGLSTNCIAFDVNLGCSGFTYGLEITGSILQAVDTQYALLLAGDTGVRQKSSLEHEKRTHAFSLLFGDAGTATLLKKDDSTPSILFSSKTDGSGYQAIIHPYGGWRNPNVPSRALTRLMDDISVFNFGNEEASAQIVEFLEHTQTTPDNYDCLVLHQANLMILKRIAKKTGFPEKKNLISIDRFGNTSSASIPITLVHNYGDDVAERKIRVLCCGFGVGLSWATTALTLNTQDILPLIHTDDYFVDGFGD